MSPLRVVATENPQFIVDMDAARAELCGTATLGTYTLPRTIESQADEDEIVATLADVDGMLVRVGTVTSSLIERLPRLKVMALHGVGVDQVDVEAATELGVWVTNVPGGNGQAVVELTIGMMVSMLRRLPAGDRQLRAGGDWDASRYLGSELHGKTVGLVGFGYIGRRVATILQAIGADVIATRSDRAKDVTDHIRMLPLDALLREADIVSLHLPLTNQSRGLIDSRALGLMKPGSYLVNMARGPIVDEVALTRALTSGHLAGAALDVFETEPPDVGSPIFGLENVIVAPHMGGSTHEALATIARVAARDIAHVLLGRRPEHPVNEPPVLRA